MALFGKKKEEYVDESMLAASRIVMEQIDDDDEKAASLVEQIKKGNPLIVNFESLDAFAANKMLAFFAGATYALEGKTVKINEKTYLFAKRTEFLDGSLQNFIKNLPTE